MAHPLAAEEATLIRPTTAEKYAGSRHVGVLPIGCVQCREGAKLVLFITGLCDKECFYCPVSRDRMYQDKIFANERAIPAGDWDQIIDEARLIDAKGAGITGGDPMVVPQRVIDLCKRMKQEFGSLFHIHLYTSCEFDISWIAKMKEAGLDELRFHPEVREYGNMRESWHHAAIVESIRVGLTTMCEIPAIPRKEETIFALATYLQEIGAHGLNMNELEFSDPNVANLRRFGYEPENDEDQRVAGSRETAMKVLDAWRASKNRMAVHFCSSPYKDAIQLMQRFRRRAANVKRPFEEQTEEGTLIYGVLQPEDQNPGQLAEILRDQYEVPVEWVAVIGNHVETAPWVAEELALGGVLRELGVRGYLSEVHPTSNRVEVERIPLPDEEE